MSNAHGRPAFGPDELAELATTEVREWPVLARRWIDAGHTSDQLIDFAALSAGEVLVLADLMIDVLRSVGVEVAIDAGIVGHVFALSGLERRCREAVARTGADLRRTWRDVEIDVQVHDVLGPPIVGVQTLVGEYNSPGTEPMTAQMTDRELVETSATQVIDTLYEHIGVRWPLCTQHGGVMTPYPPTSWSGAPSWWCLAHTEPVARIGELTSALAAHVALWWCDVDTLPPIRQR